MYMKRVKTYQFSLPILLTLLYLFFSKSFNTKQSKINQPTIRLMNRELKTSSNSNFALIHLRLGFIQMMSYKAPCLKTVVHAFGNGGRVDKDQSWSMPYKEVLQVSCLFIQPLTCQHPVRIHFRYSIENKIRNFWWKIELYSVHYNDVKTKKPRNT